MNDKDIALLNENDKEIALLNDIDKQLTKSNKRQSIIERELNTILKQISSNAGFNPYYKYPTMYELLTSIAPNPNIKH